MAEDDSVDIENENGNRFEEYEWCGQKRIRATTLLEGGFRGTRGVAGLAEGLTWGLFLWREGSTLFASRPLPQRGTDLALLPPGSDSCVYHPWKNEGKNF